MTSEPNQNQHPQSSLVLQTFSRLCSAGFIPSLDLDSDSQLLEWATHTKQLLDNIDNNNNHENSVSTTAKEPKNPEIALNKFVSLFSSHLEVRGYCEYDSLRPAENNEDENKNDQEEENDENREEQKQIKSRTKISPTKPASKPTNFTGPINSALPIRGGAQLLRHGNDIARVSRMAQRLAEEVASLQQAQIRMSTQHAQELDQQAVSFRGIISELLEQQARLEREIAMMSNSTNHNASGNSSGSEVPVSPNRFNHPRPSPMPKLYIPH